MVSAQWIEENIKPITFDDLLRMAAGPQKSEAADE
jgi:hypothetical protein